MNDKTYAEFEAWWIKQPFCTLFEDVKDQMRNVWRASRVEMVIQLPDKFSPNESGDWAYWDDLVHRAIEAAGAKWKE